VGIHGKNPEYITYMHEFSLIKELRQKIIAIAREHDASKVVAVTVKLDALSHISPDKRCSLENPMIPQIAKK
jgi:hypothetical protein